MGRPVRIERRSSGVSGRGRWLLGRPGQVSGDTLLPPAEVNADPPSAATPARSGAPSPHPTDADRLRRRGINLNMRLIEVARSEDRGARPSAMQGEPWAPFSPTLPGIRLLPSSGRTRAVRERWEDRHGEHRFTPRGRRPVNAGPHDSSWEQTADGPHSPIQATYLFGTKLIHPQCDLSTKIFIDE